MIRGSVAGIVLAGGASARMGGHKPFAPFRGGALIDAVIARAQAQVSILALDIPPAMLGEYRKRYSGTVSLLPDAFPDSLGPLCGVVTGLEWLTAVPDIAWLATFPCDTPFLPHDLVAQLARCADAAPVVAKGSQAFGLWPKSCLATLRAGVEGGEQRSILRAVEALGGKVCEVRAPDPAFFNVNTLDDLETAEALSLPWP